MGFFKNVYDDRVAFYMSQIQVWQDKIKEEELEPGTDDYAKAMDAIEELEKRLDKVEKTRLVRDKGNMNRIETGVKVAGGLTAVAALVGKLGLSWRIAKLSWQNEEDMKICKMKVDKERSSIDKI